LPINCDVGVDTGTGQNILENFQSAVAGPANFLSTVNRSGSGGQVFPIYYPGYFWAYTGIHPSPGYWVIPQPNISGDWTGGLSATAFTPDPFGNPGSQFMGPNAPSFGMPFFDVTKGAGGGWMPGISTLLGVNSPLGPLNACGRYYDHDANAFKQQNMFQWPPSLSYPNISGNGNYLQCPDFQSGLVVGLYDTAGTFIPRQTLVYQPQTFTGVCQPPLQNNLVVFDNALFQAIWTGVGPGGSQYGISPFKGGWVIIFYTNGAGPTGQLWEIVLADAFLTTYNLIQLIPQEAHGSAALTRSGLPGLGWQVTVDQNGVLYFNSGSGTDSQNLWYSYSPIPWPYPQFTYKPGTFSLPCYTPCYPLTP
jgi:hypothetical protein